jgi:hypothetical protein
LDLFLTAFPPYLPPLSPFPFVVEKIHPLLFPPSEGLVFLFVVVLNEVVVTKKKKYLIPS